MKKYHLNPRGLKLLSLKTTMTDLRIARLVSPPDEKLIKKLESRISSINRQLKKYEPVKGIFN